MTQEKRVIIATSLVMGLLLLWSVLTPPTKMLPPAAPSPEAKPQLVAGPAAADPIQEVAVGPVLLGVGERSGGIRSIQVDGAQVLAGAMSGMMEMEEASTAEGILLRSRIEGDSLVSEGALRNGTVLVRRILRPGSYASDFRLEGELEFVNGSNQEQDLQIRVVAYRPLHAVSKADAAFLAGKASVGGKLENLAVAAGRSKRLSGAPSWVASYGKSHLVVFRPEVADGLFHVEHPAGAGAAVGWLELPAMKLPPKQTLPWRFYLYAGPTSLEALRAAGMEEALSFGPFSEVTRFLLGILNKSYGWLHSYGLAICLLSVAVWLPFAPITWYGTLASQRTMKKMAALKPQEARIRKEHSNNPSQIQRELMGLYRKHGVNPAGGCLGCLPFLFTWPIYIALFQVLNRAPELRGARFLWIRDLSAPDALIRFPTSLPLLGEGLNILPVISTALAFVQQKMMAPTQTAMTEEQRIQQQMFRFFPLLFLVLFYHLPSGFMLYWVVNSLLMSGQQLLVARSIRR